MTRLAPLILALAFAACGGSDRYADERAQVEKLAPDAEDVSCTGEPGRAVECEGAVDGEPLFCEFRFAESGDGAAYSGTSSCWSERGRP